jgi:hypothetical protein
VRFPSRRGSTDVPVASSTRAATTAGAPSRKETLTRSPLPSGAGATTAGETVRPVSVSAGGGAPRRVPSEPFAGSTPSPEIVQVNEPTMLAGERHVQSTIAPVPFPTATVLPRRSAIVTVHGIADESRAWKRTGPPSRPATDGA